MEVWMMQKIHSPRRFDELVILFLVISFFILFAMAGCGGGGGGGGDGDDNPGIETQATNAINEIGSEVTQETMDRQSLPLPMRTSAMLEIPELNELVNLGSSAVDPILDEFRQSPTYNDDVQISLFAYALELIGDPKAVPVLADWLEQNMFIHSVGWPTDFVTHTIKSLSGQENLNTESCTYLVGEKYDTIAQARGTVGSTSQGDDHTIIAKANSGALGNNVCQMAIRFYGLDSNNNEDYVDVDYRIVYQDHHELLENPNLSADLRAGCERRIQNWKEVDEFRFGGTSYIPDIGEEVTNEANCGGMVTQTVFSTISSDGNQGINLPRGISSPVYIEAVAKKFGEEVTMDQMDLLTVISFQYSDNGASQHVEIPVEIFDRTATVLSKDDKTKVRRHEVNMDASSVKAQFQPIVDSLGGDDAVDVKFYRINPERITNIVVDSSKCLDVNISADPQSTFVNEWVFFNSTVSGGTAPYLYEWNFGDTAKSTHADDSHAYSIPGTFDVRLTVTDANDVPARKTLQVDVQGSAIEYVLYYTANVHCWGAPWLYLGSREKFNSTEYRCNLPGGGIDCSQELEKIEIQGDFDTIGEAQNWICPKITGWHFSYWCGGARAHYIVDGQRLDFRLGPLGCDLTNVPEVPIPDPHPYP
jgi:hypothetical protein